MLQDLQASTRKRITIPISSGKSWENIIKIIPLLLDIWKTLRNGDLSQFASSQTPPGYQSSHSNFPLISFTSPEQFIFYPSQTKQKKIRQVRIWQYHAIFSWNHREILFPAARRCVSRLDLSWFSVTSRFRAHDWASLQPRAEENDGLRRNQSPSFGTAIIFALGKRWKLNGTSGNNMDFFFLPGKFSELSSSSRIKTLAAECENTELNVTRRGL